MSPIKHRPRPVEEERSTSITRGKENITKLNESSTSEDAAPRARSGRMGKSKTRTGCITCKIRRIKCDEGKPACMRCTVSGRQCDGYRQPAQLKGATSHPLQVAKLRPATAALRLHLIIKFNHRIPPQPVEYLDRASDEHRALEYFRCCTAAVLSHWVVENFWKYQLPQTADFEPATRHAMIALAKLHENVELQREGVPNDPRISPEAMASRLQYSRYHYDIAVSELARALSERTDSEEVALMVCALFVIYNFISGNFSAAVFHMHNGIEIMSRWKMFKLGSRDLPEGSLERNLLRIFGRLSHKSVSLDEIVTEPPDPEFIPFLNLQAARTSIDCLTRERLRLLRIGAVLAHNPQGMNGWDDLDLQASAFFVDLSHWLSKFDNLVASIPTPHSPDDLATIYLLRIMHISAHIWIWVGLTPPDAEEPTSILERFLDLVEDMHAKWSDGTLHCPGLHVLDMGIIPPINFIARKSHNQVLKDRAQALLLKAAPLIIMNTQMISVPPIGTLSLMEENFVVSQSIDLESAMAEIGEDGTVEVEVQPGATQIGISLKPKRSGDGWEVRKDFAV